MNSVIWKYPLAVADRQRLELPAGAVPLSAAVQHDRFVLYAHVDPGATAKDVYEVYIHGTGHRTQFPVGTCFLGTLSMHGGELMFHVFVAKEERRDS